MKVKIMICLACVAIGVLGLAACSDPAPTEPTEQIWELNRLISAEGAYLGFESLPEYSTPQEALDDGCLVIEKGALFGGAEHWDRFLELSAAGDECSLRVVQFISGKPTVSDLLYTAGSYHLFETSHERQSLVDRPFQHLRALTGVLGSQLQERTTYVLTDSLELTYQQVHMLYLSSDYTIRERTPEFAQLSFLIYLPEDEK